MRERTPVNNLESVTILTTDIKAQTKLFLQNQHAFWEPKRKLRQINLDPQALSKFNDLPINLAQITDAKMQVVVTSAVNTQLTMFRDSQEVDKFKHTDPQTIFVHLNFKDKQKPGITFIFSLELGDGQPFGAHITQINPNVGDKDTRKPSYRKNIASDLTAVRDLLREFNKKDVHTKGQ